MAMTKDQHATFRAALHDARNAEQRVETAEAEIRRLRSALSDVKAAVEVSTTIDVLWMPAGGWTVYEFIEDALDHQIEQNLIPGLSAEEVKQPRGGVICGYCFRSFLKFGDLSDHVRALHDPEFPKLVD